MARNYRTLPGFIVVPEAARVAAAIVGKGANKSEESIWYARIHDWIRHGVVTWKPIGVKRRVKQVKESEVVELVKKEIGINKEEKVSFIGKQQYIDLESVEKLEQEKERQINNVLDLYDDELLSRKEIVQKLTAIMNR